MPHLKAPLPLLGGPAAHDRHGSAGGQDRGEDCERPGHLDDAPSCSRARPWLSVARYRDAARRAEHRRKPRQMHRYERADAPRPAGCLGEATRRTDRRGTRPQSLPLSARARTRRGAERAVPVCLGARRQGAMRGMQGVEGAMRACAGMQPWSYAPASCAELRGATCAWLRPPPRLCRLQCASTSSHRSGGREQMLEWPSVDGENEYSVRKGSD